MSTFLTLCQRVRQECGVAGDGPSTVVSQTGVLKKIVDRTSRAWVDIQSSRPYWKFARTQTTFVTVAATNSYALDTVAPNLRLWDRTNTFIYLTDTDDESKLSWLTYDEFRTKYRTRVSARPTKIFEGLSRTLQFETSPDDVYTVTLNYWRTPVVLAANTDEPALQAHLEDIIVWKSVMMFAGSEGATDLYAHAKSQYAPLYTQLMIEEADLPPAQKAYPIARGNRSLTDPGFGSN